MPSVYAIVTRGFGTFAGVADVPTRGFGTGAAPPAPAVTQSGGVKQRLYRARGPLLPWEKIKEQDVVVAKTKRKRIKVTDEQAAAVGALAGVVPHETFKEVAAPSIHVPWLGTAILADIDDDDEVVVRAFFQWN